MSEVPNSEILLIYEAKNCNPNGDPDKENRPRIDPKTRVNLVSDVRLKRFFRDYIATRFGEQYIYVTKISGVHVKADQRVALVGSENLPRGTIIEKLKLTDRQKIERLAEEVPKLFIDARLFGATIPIGGEERGAQKAFIGPVQFAWGFSLHPVELIESSTITSIFTGREAAEQYGTIGKDWRVYYSLISFYGVVSGRRASQTFLDGEDLKVLDEVLWKSLITEPTTRSKIGERPHLYLRVEYNDSETLIGDLRRYIDTEPREIIREFKDVNPKFDRLLNVLKEYRERISKIYVNCSEETSQLKDQLLGVFKDKVQVLPHGLKNDEIQQIIARYYNTI